MALIGGLVNVVVCLANTFLFIDNGEGFYLTIAVLAGAIAVVLLGIAIVDG